MVYNIGILEDNTSLRESIEEFLKVKEGYNIVFSTGKLEDLAFQNASCDPPDFILLDEHLEDSSGSAAIRSIKKKYSQTHIVVMTGDKDEQLIITALENGASGFLYKPFSISQLEHVFMEITENGSFLQGTAATKLINLLNSKSTISEIKYNELTNKEREIARLIAKGKSYKEIAEIMSVSFFTVNHHIKNIYSKYGVSSMGQLVYKLNNKSV